MGIMAENSAKTSAVIRATMPLIKNPMKTADPANLEATPVKVKTPEPIVFPKPSITREYRVYVGLNLDDVRLLSGVFPSSSF